MSLIRAIFSRLSMISTYPQRMCFSLSRRGDKIREINILGLSNSLSVRGTAYPAILNYAGRDFALIYGFQDYRGKCEAGRLEGSGHKIIHETIVH